MTDDTTDLLKHETLKNNNAITQGIYDSSVYNTKIITIVHNVF